VFLPADEYPISTHIAGELARGSVIGSHDTKHDGKLVTMRRQSALLARLKKSKTTLQNLFEREITHFRAPLLQFSRRIAIALGEAGYTADFSVPCWEPIHPSTMNGSGIESAQPFRVENITEFPLTLFQDHQLLNVMRLSTREAVKFWTEQARTNSEI